MPDLSSHALIYWKFKLLCSFEPFKRPRFEPFKRSRFQENMLVYSLKCTERHRLAGEIDTYSEQKYPETREMQCSVVLHLSYFFHSQDFLVFNMSKCFEPASERWGGSHSSYSWSAGDYHYNQTVLDWKEKAVALLTRVVIFQIASYKDSSSVLLHVIYTWYLCLCFVKYNFSRAFPWLVTTGPCLEVTAGELVKLQLRCKGHLTISCSSEMLGKAPSKSQCQIPLPSDVVRAINDQACGAAHLAKGEQLCKLSNNAKILDLSRVPILGLLLLQDQPSRKLTWVPHPGSESFFSSFVRYHSLEKSVCLAPELESVSDQSNQGYDVLIFNAFEPSGLLQHRLFEDVALLRWALPVTDITVAKSVIYS